MAKDIYLLDRHEVRRRTTFSDATIDREEAADRFPKRIRLSARAVRWYAHEIDDYLASRPRAENCPPDHGGDLSRRGWTDPQKAKERAEEKRAEGRSA